MQPQFRIHRFRKVSSYLLQHRQANPAGRQSTMYIRAVPIVADALLGTSQLKEFRHLQDTLQRFSIDRNCGVSKTPDISSRAL